MQKNAAILEDRYVTTAVYMDTLVTIDVADPSSSSECAARVSNAFGWFAHIERLCSRFDPISELSRLSASPPRTAVPVSPVLFELLDFACSVAAVSNGAFDPTVGHAMQTSGFNRNYLTGEQRTSPIDADASCSYRDVVLNCTDHTVTLMRPMVLDLGAVAKGLAIDLAAQELCVFPNFLINAGGDIIAHGSHSPETPWGIGIRHPRAPGTLIDTLVVTDAAVCTSGDYERPRPDGEAGHHILDPLNGEPAAGVASVTVVAPSAMLADAFSTAAFVLHSDRAIELLERQGVEGVIVTADLRIFETKGLAKYRP